MIYSDADLFKWDVCSRYNQVSVACCLFVLRNVTDW